MPESIEGEKDAILRRIIHYKEYPEWLATMTDLRDRQRPWEKLLRDFEQNAGQRQLLAEMLRATETGISIV